MQIVLITGGLWLLTNFMIALCGFLGGWNIEAFKEVMPTTAIVTGIIYFGPAFYVLVSQN